MTHFFVPWCHSCYCSSVKLDLGEHLGWMFPHWRVFFFSPTVLFTLGVIGTGRSPHSFPFTMHYTCVRVRQMRERWWDEGMSVWVKKEEKGVGNRKASELWRWESAGKRERERDRGWGGGVGDQKMPEKKCHNVLETEKEINRAEESKMEESETRD